MGARGTQSKDLSSISPHLAVPVAIFSLPSQLFVIPNPATFPAGVRDPLLPFVAPRLFSPEQREAQAATFFLAFATIRSATADAGERIGVVPPILFRWKAGLQPCHKKRRREAPSTALPLSQHVLDFRRLTATQPSAILVSRRLTRRHPPMTRRTLEIAAFCAALLIAALAIHAWLSSRDEKQRLQSTLAAQKQILDAADTREQTRQATLNDALAKIETLKRAMQTPQQILRDLPQYLPLPQPITLAPADDQHYPQQGTALPTKSETAPQPSPTGPVRSARSAEPTASSPLSTGDLPHSQPAIPCNPDNSCALEMPSADLKPLYDFTQNCRECQLRLTVAQQDHADDLAKLDALSRQRDAAITAAKGGTLWRRLRRNALWFVVGAGAGAAAHIAATR